MENNEAAVRWGYTAGTGKPARVLVIEVDPENPVVSETIVTHAGEPGPIVTFRYRQTANEPAEPESSM